jgi:hypothetical protein
MVGAKQAVSPRQMKIEAQAVRCLSGPIAIVPL